MPRKAPRLAKANKRIRAKSNKRYAERTANREARAAMGDAESTGS